MRELGDATQLLNQSGVRREVYRHEADWYVIEINLREARQLFNTLDPSPFRERDLDPAAEEYLVSAAREIGHERTKLLIHLLEFPARDDYRVDLPLAIRNYFEYRSAHAREQLRLMFGRGLFSLGIGVAFLCVCLWLRAMAGALAPSSMTAIAGEGLLILGWVAMWRPVEIFLYDWWPVVGQRRIFLRLAAMPIEIQVAMPPGSATDHHRSESIRR